MHTSMMSSWTLPRLTAGVRQRVNATAAGRGDVGVTVAIHAFLKADPGQLGKRRRNYRVDQSLFEQVEKLSRMLADKAAFTVPGAGTAGGACF